MKTSKGKSKSLNKKAEEKQKKVLEALKEHGAKIYDDLDNSEFPKFSIPSRSISNIVYDKKIRQYILGNAAAVRSSKNTSQLRSFTQLMWLAFFANRLTKEKKSSTLRDSIIHLRLLLLNLRISLTITSLFRSSNQDLEDFHVYLKTKSIFGIWM